MRAIRKSGRALSFAGKLLVGLLIISPVLLGLSLSFMSASELASIPPHFLPSMPTSNAYQKVLASVPIFRFMANSFLVCGVVIAGQVITCSMAAYSFSFFQFKGRKILFMVVLSTMMIPADAIIISNYLTISQWRLNDTYFALVLPYLTSAMGIFLMRQSFLTIPKEIKEASLLEGCSELRFLLRIAMPISIPSVAALGVYVFIQTYNQFLWPLLVTNTQNMRTVQIGMDMLKNAEATDYSVVLAGAVIILVPVIFVFIFGQRYLVKGMTAGGVKG
ncbi:MAG: carbohydrate ABC transporter permease [Oscillospiraceae bacterium]